MFQGLPPLEEPLSGQPQTQGQDTTMPGSTEPQPQQELQQPKAEQVEASEAASVEAEAGGQPVGEQAEAKMEVEEKPEEVKMQVDGQVGEKEKEKEDTKPRVLLSGMENTQRKELTEIIQRLEGSVTEDPGEATHLVMPRLSRTNNFLLCLPSVTFILGPSWVTESGARDKWVGEEDFSLEDPEMEARFNFSLARTLARGSRDKLFAGKVFYLTPSVKPSLQILSQIITASGGR